MDIWKHGVYADTWSLVHFLSGFLLAGVSHKFSVELLPASIAAVVLLLLWEVFEWLIKIIEPSVNVAVDIIVGVLGFSLGAFLFYSAMISTGIIFYGAGAVAILLSLWGFFDFYKKGYR